MIVLTVYFIIPVLPVIDYLINKDFISKNLCINRNKPHSCCKGKCYLVKQLKKSSANTEGESKNSEKRVQLKDADQFLVNKTWRPLLQKKNIHYFIFNATRFQILAVNAVFVPPKVS